MSKTIGSRTCPTLVLLVLASIAVGCGGSDESESSAELVRFSDDSTLDFRMDENEGEEHILRNDEETVINRDGTGTRTSSLFEGARDFDVSRGQIVVLQRALDRVDLDRLERVYGAAEKDPIQMALTYDGRTVTVGGKMFSENEGVNEDPQVRDFLTVVQLITDSASEVLPEPAELGEVPSAK